MVLSTYNRCLEHPVCLVVDIVVFPPCGHDFKMTLDLAVTHWVIFQLQNLAISQYL